MTALYWLTGLLCAGLFVYLLIALWRAVATIHATGFSGAEEF